MSLTLRTAITASDTTFDVLGSDDLQPGDYKTIDSETIVIRTVDTPTRAYGDDARYRVTVYRGSEGTRKSAHAASAELAAYSGGGGGEQTVRLLGPFTVTHETPNVATWGAATFGPTIEAGAVVVALWAVVTEEWNDTPGNGALGLTTDVGAIKADIVTGIVWEGDPEFTYTAGLGYAPWTYPGSGASVAVPYSVEADAKLNIWIPGAAAATTGEIKVYALIAEPSA